jgi:methylase of polypeptide subunit release factors
MQGAEAFVLKGKEILNFKFLREPLRGISPQTIDIPDSFRNLKLRKKPAIIFYKPDTSLGALQIQPTLNDEIGRAHV